MMRELPEIWQNTDCFPVGPREYVCGSYHGLTELCLRLAGAMKLTPYDVSYKLAYLGLEASGLTVPRLEMVRPDYPGWVGDHQIAHLSLYLGGGTVADERILARIVGWEQATELRFGPKCPTCAGRHAGKPCRYEVYVRGAELLSR